MNQNEPYDTFICLSNKVKDRIDNMSEHELDMCCARIASCIIETETKIAASLLNRLKQILKHQIDWYKEKKILEDQNKIDMLYIYNGSYEIFATLSKGDYLEIMEILAND